MALTQLDSADIECGVAVRSQSAQWERGTTANPASSGSIPACDEAEGDGGGRAQHSSPLDGVCKIEKIKPAIRRHRQHPQTGSAVTTGAGPSAVPQELPRLTVSADQQPPSPEPAAPLQRRVQWSPRALEAPVGRCKPHAWSGILHADPDNAEARARIEERNAEHRWWMEEVAQFERRLCADDKLREEVERDKEESAQFADNAKTAALLLNCNVEESMRIRDQISKPRQAEPVTWEAKESQPSVKARAALLEGFMRRGSTQQHEEGSPQCGSSPRPRGGLSGQSGPGAPRVDECDGLLEP